MGCFADRARRVRDSTLAHGQRVAALCSCARWYHPVGYRATLSFLAEVAGPYQRHEHALLRALDMLESSRAVWLTEIHAYRARRAAEKQDGHSTPRRGDRQPVMNGGHWHETRPDISRRAALHALKLWEQDHETADPAMRALVRACVATGGRVSADQLAHVRDKGWPAPLVASAAGLRPATLVEA
jgi:hypothetical protein